MVTSGRRDRHQVEMGVYVRCGAKARACVRAWVRRRTGWMEIRGEQRRRRSAGLSSAAGEVESNNGRCERKMQVLRSKVDNEAVKEGVMMRRRTMRRRRSK